MLEHNMSKQDNPQPADTSSGTTDITGIALEPQDRSAYRISSYTLAEKSLLCELVRKYAYRRERKTFCTPSSSHLIVSGGVSKQKCKSTRVRYQSWEKIMEEYNSKQISSRRRNVQQLKKCWGNMKHRRQIVPPELIQPERQSYNSLNNAVNGAVLDKDIETTIRNITSNNVSREERDNLTPPDDVIFIEETKPFVVQQAKPPQSRFTTSATPESIVSTVPVVTTQLLGLPTSRLSYSTLSQSQANMVSARIVASAREQFRRVPLPHLPMRQQGPSPNYNLSNVKLMEQRMKRLEMKLISTQIKEHETKIQQYRQELQHEQVRHDVIMRVLQTKAAIYDAKLRAIESQNNSRREFEFVNDDMFQQSDDEEFIDDLA